MGHQALCRAIIWNSRNRRLGPGTEQNRIYLGQGRTSRLGGRRLVLGMKTLYKKASHLRAHTWKDIGGVRGLVLDMTFFVFLVFVSVIMTIVGFIGVVLAFVFSPVLALVSYCGKRQKKDWDDSILLDDGTLGHRPSPSTETVKSQHLSGIKTS